MCFDREKVYMFSAPKVAQNDIIVYKSYDKYADGKVKSPHRNQEVKPGQLLKAKQFGYRNAAGTISDESDGGYIHEGIHSYKFQYDAKNGAGNRVWKCKIPKGTKYHVNDKEYVSLALQLPGEVVTKKKKKSVTKRKPKMASR